MGDVGGSAFHFLRGAYHSPRGERFIGGSQAIRMNAPRVGGSFAVWGGLFSTFDCAMVYARQKEDPWNAIIAGAATGGFLQVRQGLRAASRSALFGGALLALIEGAGITLNKLMTTPQSLPPMEEQPGGFETGQVPGRVSTNANAESVGPSSSWFGGFFGGGKKEESGGGGGVGDVPIYESRLDAFTQEECKREDPPFVLAPEKANGGRV